MDSNMQAADRLVEGSAEGGAASSFGPHLSLVTSRFALAQPAEPVPAEWRAALEQLLAWLRIDAAFIPATRSGPLAKVADWAMLSAAAGRSVPLFAPWCGWAPSAFQHGGVVGLPQAQWAASYLLDQGRGASRSPGGIDLVLMSPHPATCAAEEAGGAPVPRAAVLRAMIRAAKAEGREQVAIITHARQRNPIARQLLAAGRALTRDGLTLDILTIEDALPPLMQGAAPWDAIIAMPDVRSIIATLLRESSGVRAPWPMLWYGGGLGGSRADALMLVASEAAGEGAIHPALDAPALIHALGLSLHHAGITHAAARLYEGWARLRDRGVSTLARGSSAPYVSQVTDADFIGLLCKDGAASTRPVPGWRAIGHVGMAARDRRPVALRLVPSNTTLPPR